MKLLSFQPYSLYAAGGGSRILRRLYEGKENHIQSLVVSGYPSDYHGPIEEIIIYARPVHRPWMRSFVRGWATWLRTKGLYKVTEKKILKTVLNQKFDVIHIVNHGVFSTALCNNELIKDKLLWVSFHDHFSSIGSSFEQAGLLWARANRRLVISEELGEEYKRLFGDKPYEIITDGVTGEEITPAPEHNMNNGPITVYFAGLLHLDYIPLFRVLADALDKISKGGKQVKLILRGTQKLDFLDNRKFITEYKPLIIDNKVLKEELDSATILYLPMKFTDTNFFLYSLSTKMVGYLGAPGAILYHGPGESAASRLLIKNNAASVCENFDACHLATKINETLKNRLILSNNAKRLASRQFDIETIRKNFWKYEQS